MAFLRQTDTAQQIQLTAVVGDPMNLIVSLSIDRSFVRWLLVDQLMVVVICDCVSVIHQEQNVP